MTEPKTDTRWVAEDQDTWDHDPLSLASALWLPPAWPQEGYGDPILCQALLPMETYSLGGWCQQVRGQSYLGWLGALVFKDDWR